jgi:PAS domain S-box-containing protein
VTLNRQSNLLAWLGLVVVLAVLVGTGLSASDVRRQTREILIAEETVKSVTHFRFLILETALYREPRSQVQWQQSIQRFRQLLETRRYGEDDENALLKKERANLEVLANLYTRLVSGSQRLLTMPQANDLSQLAVAGTVSALFLTTQDMVDDAFELVRLNRVGLEASQERAARLTMLSIAMMACLIAAGCLIIKRRVLVPLSALQAAIGRAKQGDLTHRVALAIGNEIGTLAASFDRLTQQLEGSRNALTAENAERRAAQESLQTSVGQLAFKSGQLEQAQQELQTIIDHTPAIVVYWDSTLHNRFANRAYEDWFGTSPQDMRGRHISDIIGAERLGVVLPHLQRVLAGDRQVFESTVTSPSGQVREALFSYVPDIDEGRVKGIYGFISDITQLKQAQSAQAAALARLQGVVEAASDFAILATDLAGQVTLFSTGAERMLGFSAQEILHNPNPVSIYDAGELRQVGAELSAAAGRPIRGFEIFAYPALQQRSSNREWTFVRKDGSRLPVSLTVAALRDQAGTPVGFLGIAQDIGEEKAIRRNLAAARDQAELANVAKSQFLANMSHELRTPMNAILGMLQLLLHTPLSVLQLDYADKTQSAAQSLLVLLNDILDFSKIEADKLMLEDVPFRVDSLMRDLSVVLSASVGERDLEIMFDIDPDLPPMLMGDTLRLRQVLLNLAGNAIKFTQRGDVVVSLAVMAADAARVRVAFSVRDTGIGIAPDHLATVFDGFSQAESSTTRRFGGTGLGLAISQRLVGLMGGSLAVESEPGVGSNFRFTADFARAPGAIEVRPTVAAVPRRVLVIDDNATARRILVDMAGALGWHGQGADSAAAALDVLRRQVAGSAPAFDTVLIDWRMPACDIWALAGSIRQQAGALPVTILLTVSAHGRARLADISAQQAASVSGFLIKPATASMLFDAVTEAAGGIASLRRTERTMPGSSRLRGLRLLVVDDNAMNQQVARELLSKQGAEIEVADGGLAAVNRVLGAAPPFDLVLMDIQMPDIDGYEATRRIRQDARMQNLPIIAMTANAMSSDRVACLAAGMNDHIGKPINLDSLVATILLHCVRSAGVGVDGPPPTMPVQTRAGAQADTPESVIRFEDALQRLGGSRDLYASMVRHFMADAQALLEDLRHSLERGSTAEAANLLHTFKSAAGIVGAHILQSRIGHHEAVLRAALPGQLPAPQAMAVADDLARLTADAQAQLVPLAAAIGTGLAADAVAENAAHVRQTENAALAASTCTAAAAPDAAPALRAQLDALCGLLAESNMRAVGVFAHIERDYGALLGSRLSVLAASMARFDFRQALTACHLLQEELT